LESDLAEYSDYRHLLERQAGFEVIAETDNAQFTGPICVTKR
jgi:hypothetical protein